MGTDEQGINIMDGKSTKYINTENSNLLSNTIQDITGYKDNIFIGTNEGLSVLVKNGDDYTITNYTEEDGLPSNKIRSLFFDSKENLWIGTYKGLAILDSNNNLTELYYRLAYPEKFWKIVNFYYNSRKVWIPEKNSEKLRVLWD